MCICTHVHKVYNTWYIIRKWKHVSRKGEGRGKNRVGFSQLWEASLYPKVLGERWSIFKVARVMLCFIHYTV